MIPISKSIARAVILFLITSVTIYLIWTEGRESGSFIYPCKIHHLTNRTCYEKSGDLFMRQNLMTTSYKKGFIFCGKIRNCDSSPCNQEILMNYNYFGFGRENDEYELGYFPWTYLFLIVLCGVSFAVTWISFIPIFEYYRDKNLNLDLDDNKETELVSIQ